MPQNAFAATTARNPSGSQSQLSTDPGGALVATDGGVSSKLNVTAAAVVKVGAGRVGTLIVVAPGTTSGAFTLNDAATTGAANAANTIWTNAYNAATNVAGASFVLNFPFTTGLVVSAVPGAGTPQLSISYS